MIKVNIKPLSVNEAFKGRRFRTKQYKDYKKDLFLLLPSELFIPDGYLSIYFEWGFSSIKCDYDNPIKTTQDVICKFYGIDDNRIFEGAQKKVIVPKGREYFKFSIDSYRDY